MTPKEEELRELRDRMLPSRQSAFRVIQRMTDEGRVPASAYAGLFNPGLTAGAVELLLGNEMEARQWFAESALAMTISFSLVWKHQEEIGRGSQLDLPIKAERALRTALLSADPHVIGGVTDNVRVLEESYVERYYGEKTRYYHFTGLAHLLQNEQDAARTALLNLREAIGRNDQYLASELAQAYADTLEGFLDDDVSLVQDAIDSLAIYNERYYAGDRRVTDIIDHRACSFVILAHHRGMDIRVENEYVPVTVQTIEWDSIGLPVDTPTALRELYEEAPMVD